MQNVTENIDVGKLLDNWDETHELTKDEALAILIVMMYVLTSLLKQRMR